MASFAPFSRRQWASQSLRVTAKELSIVSARGKNTAIAERFARYASSCFGFSTNRLIIDQKLNCFCSLYLHRSWSNPALRCVLVGKNMI
uniref:Uncharacterized protein n=1 Tax=Nothobranchius furzeri TaxID=105023 RepID=A0A8C6PCI6_NOTFU